jgi:hypothetical protein
MVRSRRQQQKNVPLKFQVNAIQKLAEKKLNVQIKLENGICEVDLGDISDVPIHTSGKVVFEKKDFEGRKKGYFVFVNLQNNETFDPIHQIPIIALGEVEGQHLVVLLTQTGDVLKKHKEYYKQWFLDIGKSGNCTIRAMEVSVASLEEKLVGRVEQVENLKKKQVDLVKQIELLEHQKRVIQSKIRNYEGLQNNEEVKTYEEKLLVLNNILISNKEDLETVDAKLEELDAPDLISSDESDAEDMDAELEQLEQQKHPKKKLQLSAEDLKAGPAIDL